MLKTSKSNPEKILVQDKLDINQFKGVQVNSEIGKLRYVLLHTPSYELESLTPSTMSNFLFDDTLYLKQAQIEHANFVKILNNNGVKVIFLIDCLKEIFLNKLILKQFILDFIIQNNIFSVDVCKALEGHYLNLTLDEFIKTLLSGIKKTELNIKLTKFTDIINTDNSLFWVNPLPNLYFTRDPSSTIGNKINIGYMRKKARRAEVLLMKYIYKYHPLFNNIAQWYQNDNNYPIEGGDILVLSKNVVAIGFSERTSAKAIEELAKKLLSDKQNQFKKVLVFKIPKARSFMHLDTVFTMIDYDKFTVYPAALCEELSVYELTLGSKNSELSIKYSNELLECVLAKALNLGQVSLLLCGKGDEIISQREQWDDASNTLAIEPGKVIVYDRNYVTNEELAKNNIKIIEMPGGELSRGRGGPRCMSMPLYRDEI